MSQFSRSQVQVLVDFSVSKHKHNNLGHKEYLKYDFMDNLWLAGSFTSLSAPCCRLHQYLLVNVFLI